MSESIVHLLSELLQLPWGACSGPDPPLGKNLLLIHSLYLPDAVLTTVEFSKCYVHVYGVQILSKNPWNATWVAERKMWKIQKRLLLCLYAVHNLSLCGFLLENLCLQAEIRFLNHLNYLHRTNTHSLILGFTRPQRGQVSLPIKPLRLSSDSILGNPK